MSPKLVVWSTIVVPLTTGPMIRPCRASCHDPVLFPPTRLNPKRSPDNASRTMWLASRDLCSTPLAKRSSSKSTNAPSCLSRSSCKPFNLGSVMLVMHRIKPVDVANMTALLPAKNNVLRYSAASRSMCSRRCNDAASWSNVMPA